MKYFELSCFANYKHQPMLSIRFKTVEGSDPLYMGFKRTPKELKKLAKALKKLAKHVRRWEI